MIACRVCERAIEYHSRGSYWTHRAPGADHPPMPTSAEVRDMGRPREEVEAWAEVERRYPGLVDEERPR